MSQISITNKIKCGLQQKYSSQLATEFQEFLDTEGYDSDLVREDITLNENVILEHLISVNAKLNEDELDQTLQDLLSNDNVHNAEPHHMDDKSDDNNSIFSPFLYDITTLNLNFSEEKERVKHLMLKYCPSLLAPDDSATTYLIFMQMMCFILQKPFNSWIMDLFDRFMIDNGLKQIDPLHFTQICSNFGTYLTLLEDLNEKEEIDFNCMIPNAMKQYQAIRPSLDFKPTHKICDSYSQFVSNVVAINAAIAQLTQKHSIYPLQLDVWFIANKINNNDDDEKKQLDDDIEEALLETYGEEHYEVHQLIWKESLKQHEHNTIMQYIHRILIGNNDDDDKTVVIERNMRYVLVIDRRQNVSEQSDTYCLLHVHKDRINPNTASYFDEEFFEKSQRFLFVTEDEEEEDWGLYDEHPSIFGLSYHVLSSDCVKMYWNISNKKIRFNMKDVTDLWPIYFDETMNDFSITALDEIKKRIHETESEHPLRDSEFEQFYRCITDFEYKHEEETIIEICPMSETDEDEDEEMKQENIVKVKKVEAQKEINEYECEDEVEVNELCSMSAMLLWLEQQDTTNKYPAYFVMFERALKEQFDETDFEINYVLDELLYFEDGEIDESEILTAIKENDNCKMDAYNEYIAGLIHDIQTYIGAVANKDSDINGYSDADVERAPINMETTNRHFLYYCCGECGNDFGKYLFDDKPYTNEEKISILSTCFWSFDYKNRKQLISILTETYELSQSQPIKQMLFELCRATVFVDHDEKWIQIFDNVFKNNQHNSLLLKLQISQITCCKNGYHLMAELKDNNIQNSEIQTLQININRIRNHLNTLNKLNINLSHAQLTNDEISVLYMMANRNQFAVLNGQFGKSCKWKSFYCNLLNALHKLKKYRYSFKIPKHLYSYTHKEDENINSYLNDITLWYSNEWSEKEIKSHNFNTMFHLKEEQKIQNIQIIPIEWVVKTGNDDTNNIFIILPFRVTSIELIHKDVYELFYRYTIQISAICQNMDVITL